jgi:hypothetical protein
MIHENYIKSVSFSIGSKKITSDQAKEILSNRVYQITKDKIFKGDIDDGRISNSLCSTTDNI